jgi:hypothetical protein
MGLSIGLNPFCGLGWAGVFFFGWVMFGYVTDAFSFALANLWLRFCLLS